ncbi:hypothetical protein [Actinoplanes sp. HUAS TT8]|uniref:hypothetical protein n=1 Tax=Actinoplanes sp. HUAS TT8 TaxID=3447453 RepID=UPI003F526F9C
MAAVLAGMTLSGCGESVEERGLTPVADRLPAVSGSPSPDAAPGAAPTGRTVLAPEDPMPEGPIRTILPGDEMVPSEDVPEPDPTARAEEPVAGDVGHAATRAPDPAPASRPRDAHRRTRKSVLPGRTNPPATVAPAAPSAKPIKKKPKKTQVPAPATEPAQTDPGAAATPEPVPERACGAAECR